MLKRIICSIMLIGALLGLTLQSAAIAAGPAYLATQEAASVSMSGKVDCENMTPMQQRGAKPCKGLTLACIADMGCSVAMTLETSPAPTAGNGVTPLPATWPMILARAGRGIAPELRPPSTLS